MKSLWNDGEASQYSGPLGLRVYTSRLLGRDRSLVLHGGGNTSVKLREPNLFGEPEALLYVKGSGWDLETIEPAGFTPVALDYVRRLATLPALSDPQMIGELATHTMRAGAPAPSVETILHAILPFTYVDHTHADAVLSVSNAPQGEARIREIYGDRVVVIPYVMAGFDLAAWCAREYPKAAGGNTIGMVLLSHGVFSFGADAREAYERMIELVSMSERYLESRKAWVVVPGSPGAQSGWQPAEVAALRKEISREAQAPMLMRMNTTEKFLGFARHPQAGELSQRGPATPDHVIRTKPWPMFGRDTAAFTAQYRAYFERLAPKAKEAKTMLDSAPRMMLDPDWGFAAIGRTAKDTAVAEELYDHTIDVILRAEALGGWRALDEQHLFDIEYWVLEQAKLKKPGAVPPFAGEVALVTGAASGIGKACVEAFLRRGAAVVALDRNPEVAKPQRPDYLGIVCDLTDRAAIAQAARAAVAQFGGVDMLVLNAGIFPASSPIATLADDALRSALTVNVEAGLAMMRTLHPLLRLAPRGGRVVVIGSKNVPAPGPGAGAYSASKAAMNQLARVAALEWAGDGIRVNTIHPNAVYDTALWTDEVLASRARAYNLTVEQYKRNNLLKTDVTSRDVAEMAAEMCGSLFAKTTAAQVPVDGGTEKLV
jgi:rhamnose utilization protein RhaD (predicted bifunctional aldolase and dehydrogenase)/NAD(P)-dependent dehydrogenase (short-subunit alcohol dehydrogenase family)